MSKDSKKPAIRFKGFTDDWEQRKLGELMDITSVKRIHQSDWTDFGVRFLRARDIVAEYKKEEISEPLFISEEKYNEYTAISGKVKIGDLLVTGVGTIGVPMLINSDKPLYFKDGNIIWFKNENTVDGKFLYFSFVNESIQKFIKESAGTGTVGTYTIDSGKKTPIYLPLQKDEQKKIGQFFSNLENLITLHQRKLDSMKELKKDFYKKTFSKDGCKAPGKNLEKWCTLECAQNNKIYPNGTIYTALSASDGIAYQLREDDHISDRYAVFVSKTSYINVFYEIFCESFDPFYQKYNQGINFAFDNFKFFDFQEITLSDNELQEMEEALKKINNLIDNEKLFIQQMKGFKDFCLNKMFC